MSSMFRAPAGTGIRRVASSDSARAIERMPRW